MAFPTTGVLDSFNRANEGPPPSASWGAPIYFGQSGLVVNTNQCAASAVDWKDSYWNATVFGADQETWFTLATLPAGTNAIFLHGRIQATGLGTSPNGYVLRVAPGTPDWLISVQTLSAGALATIGTAVVVAAANFLAGVKLGFELVGSTLKGYRDSGLGWVEMISRTDSTWTGGGRIGAEWNDTTLRIDDFGGGNVAAAGGLAQAGFLFPADLIESGADL